MSAFNGENIGNGMLQVDLAGWITNQPIGMFQQYQQLQNQTMIQARNKQMMQDQMFRDSLFYSNAQRQYSNILDSAV